MQVIQVDFSQTARDSVLSAVRAYGPQVVAMGLIGQGFNKDFVFALIKSVIKKEGSIECSQRDS